jgi:hypothetical protein
MACYYCDRPGPLYNFICFIHVLIIALWALLVNRFYTKNRQISPPAPQINITALVAISAGSRHRIDTINHNIPPADSINGPVG